MQSVGQPRILRVNQLNSIGPACSTAPEDRSIRFVKALGLDMGTLANNRSICATALERPQGQPRTWNRVRQPHDQLMLPTLSPRSQRLLSGLSNPATIPAVVACSVRSQQIHS